MHMLITRMAVQINFRLAAITGQQRFSNAVIVCCLYKLGYW